MLHASAAERAHEPESYDVDVALADGTRLSGTVGGVRDDVVFTLKYARLGPKHRLHAWIDLAALTVSHPHRQWRAVAIGRGSGSRGPKRSVLGPLTPSDAAIALEELVALYRAGLRGPLPLPVKTAAEYAYLRHRDNGAPAARKGAENKWLDDKFPGEQSDAEHVLLYGPEAPLTVLTAQQPEIDEAGPGWHADETDRFGLLARRLWHRILDAETQEQR